MYYTICDLLTDDFSFDEFIDSVLLGQRQKVRQILYNLPHVEFHNFRVTFEIRGQRFYADFFFDSTMTNGEHDQIDGYVHIEPEESSETIFDLASGVNQPLYYRSTNIYTELKENNMRTIMSSKYGLLHKCSLNLSNQQVEIDVYENGLLVKKKLSSDDFTNFIHPEEREQYIKGIKRLHKSEIAVLHQSFRSRCLSEDYKWYELIGEVMINDITGEPVKYVGILRDIDAKKRAERALQKSDRLLMTICQLALKCMIKMERL